MKNIMEIKNLNYAYGNSIIFNSFNLKIRENSFTTIAGNNTSGKTTLIKIMAGLLPNYDSVIIDYSYLDPDRAFDYIKNIGVVFGDKLDNFLFEDVYKEMAFPLENLVLDEKEIESRIINITRLFNATRLLDKKTYDLTNSEKQLLLLMISLLHKPKILLLDSPFSMMDSTMKKETLSKLIDYKERNDITIVLTTVNLEDSLDTDYLYIINKGNIVIEGKPLQVLKEDTIIKRLGLSLPFMVDLSLKLKFYGILDDIDLDMKDMVNTLWK